MKGAWEMSEDAARTRVLVIQSVEDEVAAHRVRRMTTSPLLRDFEFEQFYWIELSEKQRQRLYQSPFGRVDFTFSAHELLEQSVDLDTWEPRLQDSVEAFSPQLVIVHHGFVFRRYSIAIISVLRAVKERFPYLRMGMEGRDLDIPDHVMLFEDSKEMRDLLSEIFG
jgi:hypothetical protein